MPGLNTCWLLVVYGGRGGVGRASLRGSCQVLNTCLLSVQVLSPGLRLGWATAAPALLEKLIFHLHGSTLGPCALSQVVVSSLLQHWGPEGFEQHVKDMQLGYARRAHILHTAAGMLSLYS